MLVKSFLFVLLFSSAYAAMCNSAGWSDSDRKGILNVHNTLRSKIAKGTYVAKKDRKPSATNMLQMVYDCSLESSAQSWANTCPTGHSGKAGKGENLYWSWSTAPISIGGKGETASKSWEKEFQDHGWSSNTLTSQLFSSGIGHATQMAWWKSNKIGCGVKQCRSSNPSFKYQIVVVCQYTPQGNVINQPIYKSGKTCSACPQGSRCDAATGLCK